MTRVCILPLILYALATHGQDSLRDGLSVSGYLEVYYSYDLAKPSAHQRPEFFYSYNRHNEINLNLGYVLLNYRKSNVRAGFGLMSGTYTQYNLAHEPAALRHIYEASAGIKLSEKNKIWLDAGILPSHIGFESPAGKDAWNLSRSIVADNSPYYESGARIAYTSKDDKLYLALLYLNGWQRITRPVGNNSPAAGTQLKYTNGGNFIFNWSTFLGNEQPAGRERWRFYNNFFTEWLLSDKLGLILGFDYGIEQKHLHSKSYFAWLAPVCIMRYKISPVFNLAARAEYFSDPGEVIVWTGMPDGFRTAGYSVNADFAPAKNMLIRAEARMLSSPDPIFVMNRIPIRENYFFSMAMILSF